jgi:ParB-like chromosome segregation protein Spo0J
LDELKEHPSNPNRHPPEQIKLLAHIIAVQGWRNPIVVSNRSGLITKGHARLYAARAMNAKSAPVDYQDYKGEKEEIADMLADNRIAELADLDRSMVRELAEHLDDGEFDMDLTGFDQIALEELMTATMPDADRLSAPELNSEHLVEIYCTKIGLDAIHDQLTEIAKIDGCKVNIS